MRYCTCLIFIICFFPAKIFAQKSSSAATDITGLWKGTLYNDSSKQFYRYEIAISEEKGKLTGFSHTWFILDDKQYYGVKKIKVREEDGKIMIEDVNLIANNYPVAPAKGVHLSSLLELNAADSVMTLTGPFATNRTKKYAPNTGIINLQRKNDYWQSALVPHLEELGLVKELSFVKDDIVLNRNNQTVSLVENTGAKKTVYTITKPVAVVVNNHPIEKIKTEENKTAVATTETVSAQNKNVTPKNNPPAQKNIPVENKTAIAKTETASPVNKTISAKTISPAQKIIPVENKAAIVKTEPLLPQNKTVAVNNNLPKITPAIQPPIEIKNTINAAEKTVEPVVKNETKMASEISPAAGLKNTTPAAEVKLRTTLLQQTVFFKSDSLQLSLYDNGEVDGDTVSVLMNGAVIMSKERLSTNAIRKTIYISQYTDTVQLVMYAENLGSIPPNTGLLVVRDGKDIYEIRFSGDLQKNAAIIFRRKKEIK